MTISWIVIYFLFRFKEFSAKTLWGGMALGFARTWTFERRPELKSLLLVAPVMARSSRTLVVIALVAGAMAAGVRAVVR